jgi:flavin reductase (DIM6/NTAB) family NADH-FMN oxidoreductase RutF
MVQSSAAYPADVDEFDAVGIALSPSETVTAPRVRDAAISFECVCHDITEISNDDGVVTSRIIIGRINLIHINDAVLDADGRVDVRALDAISRLGGHDYARIGEVFTMPRPKV